MEIHALSIEGTQKRSVHCIKTLEKAPYKYLPKYLRRSNQLTVWQAESYFSSIGFVVINVFINYLVIKVGAS